MTPKLWLSGALALILALTGCGPHKLRCPRIHHPHKIKPYWVAIDKNCLGRVYIDTEHNCYPQKIDNGVEVRCPGLNTRYTCKEPSNPSSTPQS